MNRYKRIERDKLIRKTWVWKISNKGVFSVDEDAKNFAKGMAYRYQWPYHHVLRVFYKDLYIDKAFRDWLSDYSY